MASLRGRRPPRPGHRAVGAGQSRGRPTRVIQQSGCGLGTPRSAARGSAGSVRQSRQSGDKALKQVRAKGPPKAGQPVTAVTAIRAPCSLVCHHPYQNYLRPVRQNRFTPHQTPFRRCRHPTWAGLAPRRRRAARRVADRLATRGRGGAQAGRPRLALDSVIFIYEFTVFMNSFINILQ